MPGADSRPAFTEAQEQRVTRVRNRALVVGAMVGLALVVFSAIAVLVSDVLRVGGAQPALAQRARTKTATAADPLDCRSKLTPSSPLRLWIGGDSLAGSLGPSLGAQTASTGIVQPVYDSRVSSGLGSPEFFDWPHHAAEEMARLDPDVVVFIVGANDWTTPRATPVDTGGEPAWRADYAARVETMLATLQGPSAASTPARTEPRSVYWVGSPTLQDKRKDLGVQEVNAVARAVVARHPSATYVDAYQLFSSPGGGYTATLTGSNGKAVRVRTGDGVHFTPEGGDVLGVKIFDLIDTECRLDAQSVVGQTKPVLESAGSTQIPGTHREVPDEATPAPVAPPTTTTSIVSTTTTSSTTVTTTTTATSTP